MKILLFIFIIRNPGVLIFVSSLYGIVFLQEGFKNYSTTFIETIKLKLTRFWITRTTNYIPLRFNQAGVMPIILTTAILVVPNYISNLGSISKD
jgi:preprotein translocase subunit SecY